MSDPAAGLPEFLGETASAKRRMRELASAYAARVPSLDAHGLMDGLEGVQLRFMPMGQRDGAYDPEHHVILINSQVRPERQRFTLAHEISHALLLGDDDLLSDLHDSFEGERLEQVIETLCNVGAAAILMPDALIAELLERFGPTGRALAELSRRADVSASTALYALADHTPGAVLYAVCTRSRLEYRLEGEADEEEASASGTALTVRVSGGSAGVKYTLRPGTPIPPDHPVHAAFESNLPMREASYVPFRSGRKMPAEVDAFPVRGRVMVSFDVTGRSGA